MALLHVPTGNEFFVEHEIWGICGAWGGGLLGYTLPSSLYPSLVQTFCSSFNELTVRALKSDVNISKPILSESPFFFYQWVFKVVKMRVESFFMKKKSLEIPVYETDKSRSWSDGSRSRWPPHQPLAPPHRPVPCGSKKSTCELLCRAFSHSPRGLVLLRSSFNTWFIRYFHCINNNPTWLLGPQGQEHAWFLCVGPSWSLQLVVLGQRVLNECSL